MSSFIGLPSLPKLSAKGILNSVLSSVQTQFWNALGLNPVWGIFESGSSTLRAIEVDSVIEVGIKEKSEVPDYRIQTGSFASFNKVIAPTEVSVVITKTGSDTEREYFVAWLKAALNAPTVYDVITRDTVYHNFTLTEFSLERTAENGIDRVVADCNFVEVREAPEQYYDATQGTVDTSNTGDADAIPINMEKKVQTIPAGVTGNGVQEIFSLNRITTSVGNFLNSVKESASAITTSITKTASSYASKVKEWFS